MLALNLEADINSSSKALRQVIDVQGCSFQIQVDDVGSLTTPSLMSGKEYQQS